jgi:hypothetical protein
MTMAAPQKSGTRVIALTAARPSAVTLGKTADGRFAGENTGASLYRPQNRTAKGANLRLLRRTP